LMQLISHTVTSLLCFNAFICMRFLF
jgi:hypothetical protein